MGIFIDYENLYHNFPPAKGMDIFGFLPKLVEHYSKMGDIVCTWAIAVSFNHGTKVQLQKLAISPKDNPMKKWEKEGVADFILLEVITEMADMLNPDIFILVTGDADFTEKIKLLNKNGKSVRLAVFNNKIKDYISKEYSKYFEERKALNVAMGGTNDQCDFVIDELDELLNASPNNAKTIN